MFPMAKEAQGILCHRMAMSNTRFAICPFQSFPIYGLPKIIWKPKLFLPIPLCQNSIDVWSDLMHNCFEILLLLIAQTHLSNGILYWASPCHLGPSFSLARISASMLSHASCGSLIISLPSWWPLTWCQSMTKWLQIASFWFPIRDLHVVWLGAPVAPVGCKVMPSTHHKLLKSEYNGHIMITNGIKGHQNT